MNQKYLVLLVALFAIACNNTNSKTSESKPETTATAPRGNCYQYASNGDTIVLKYNQNGETISGALVYNLSGKDKNKGTIVGNMRGDLLVADYTFMSEGITSVRQVAFKKDNNNLIEGYGAVTTTVDGEVVFKNLDSLSYNNSFRLVPIDCYR